MGGASGMLAARPANQRPARPANWEADEARCTEEDEEEGGGDHANGSGQTISLVTERYWACSVRHPGGGKVTPSALPRRSLSGLPGFSTRSSPGGGVEHHRRVSAIFIFFFLSFVCRLRRSRLADGSRCGPTPSAGRS